MPSPPALREQYGRTPVGQGALLARRLVEGGVRFVTVAKGWLNYDTHGDNFNIMKKVLLPEFDRAFAALLEDLHQRGMLDSTLVIAMGEFGRTPKVNDDAGRDHHNKAWSIALAGAGIPGGRVLGATDKTATEVTDLPGAARRPAAHHLHHPGRGQHARVSDAHRPAIENRQRRQHDSGFAGLNPFDNIFSLSGKTALVAGASRGIGLAIAQALSAPGAHTILAARSMDKLEAHAAAIAQRPRARISMSPAPIPFAQAVGSRGRRRYPGQRLRHQRPQALRAISRSEEYERILQTNLHGIVELTQLVGAKMIAPRRTAARSSTSAA